MTLYTISIEDDTKLTPIISCPSVFPTVSPDEKYVAYMWGGELQIVELSTKSLVASWTAPPMPWVGASVNWSPNGRELGIQGIGLWIYNLDTKTAANVLSGHIAWHSWSRPDKSLFAFQRQYNVSLQRAIWVAKLDPNLSTAESLGPGRTVEEYYQEMVDYYTRLIDTAEGPGRRLSRAECYIYLHNREKALADLEHCAKLLTSRNHPAAALVTKLAVLCREQKRYEEVEQEFVKVLEFSRRRLGARPLQLKELARLQATYPAAEFRDGAKAVENATKACELTDWKNADYVDTLAASYAEAGDFDLAVKCQKKAIDLLTEDASAESRSNYESRLNLYQSGKPYRQVPLPTSWQTP